MAFKRLTSKQAFYQKATVDKRWLRKTISNKKNKVNHYHSLSIINLFLEEVLISLKEGKSINMGNFGTFYTFKMKSKDYYDLNKNKNTYNGGNIFLKFKINDELKKILLYYLDEKKTFEG